MRLHPTLFTVFPGTPVTLLGELRAVWAARPGPLLQVLEVLEHPQPLTPALRRLLDQGRALALQQGGHSCDTALTLVWLAEAHDSQLLPALQALQVMLDTPDWAGLELRLHLLLLLPDVCGAPQHTDAARATLEALAPDDHSWPLTRVWPISARNRSDLFLSRPSDLTPLIAAFVERTVLGDAPLYSTAPAGRDLAALGACRIETAGLPAHVITQALWGTLLECRLAPAPALPAPPLVPPDDAGPEAYETLEQELLALEETLPWEYGRAALLGGLAHLNDAVRVLDEAYVRAAAALEEALAPFDALFGASGKRARLKRLDERMRRGRDVDEAEVRRLRAALEPIDEALASEHLEALLERDMDVTAMRRRVEEAREKAAELRAALAALPEAQPPQPRGCLTFWQRSKPDPNAAQRNQLEMRLERAQAEEKAAREALQAAERRYRRALLTQRAARAYHDAVNGERQRLRVAQTNLQAFVVSGGPEGTSQPLVLSLPQRKPLPPELLERHARALIASGYAELFWDGDLAEAKARLTDAARALRGDLPLDPPDLADDALWITALRASAPRIVARNAAAQHLSTLLIGEAPLPPIERDLWTDPDGFPGEVLLLQVLQNLQPADLLGLDAPAVPTTEPGPEAEDPPAPLPVPQAPLAAAAPGLQRPNGVLDELFAKRSQKSGASS
ncbi:hypothetical protein HNR42_003133 [Deinobacterium chartae]|uniref:Uncharacterized protein n=1 Tax=Deinobacterium chartae TaxID=521158 RepID=A0A841I778_9DEIO|nr:hypothetical protein [Deinobacterium chartae]MBB6099675.1 hypothetical protein [Deinobacterium chartae]